MKGSNWFDVAAPLMLGLVGLTFPSFLSVLLVFLVYRKVVTIRNRKAFTQKSHFEKDSASGNSVSGVESRQNNEAITIITMLSLYHFFTYAPFSVVGTTRSSIGFLFSSPVLTLLAGTSTSMFQIGFM